jgi:hypothetical protein
MLKNEKSAWAAEFHFALPSAACQTSPPRTERRRKIPSKIISGRRIRANQ